MEFISFKNTTEVVTIEIEITGIIVWRYVYVDHGTQYIRASSDSSPYRHALGFPHEIDGHFNSWDIQMANITDKDQEYGAKITWRQGDDVLNVWKVPVDGEPPAEKKVKAKSGKVRKGNSLFD